jgi:NAD+ diphosphatase
MDPIAFAGNPLDRASAERPGADWLCVRQQKGLFLPFWQLKPLLLDGRARFLPWRPEWDGCPLVFLGLDGEQPLFAVSLGSDKTPPELNGEFKDMRSAALLLPGADTAIAGQAKVLLDWHARHGFCPNCGHATEVMDGGYRRVCLSCAAEHFPRTDPVVIMLPVFEDQCLVGRNMRFADNMYSAFAGFVEPGETVEEAVRREVKEETGLVVGDVRYQRSQPWPFPSALMLGCTAQALSQDVRVDGTEIVEARWLTKAQARSWVADGMWDGMKISPPIAIAHHLIRDWAEG